MVGITLTTMGTKQTAEYYDKAFTEERYTCHYTESPYYPLYTNIINTCGYLKDNLVVFEVGCGTGQFADYFSDKFSYDYYIGCDFSKTAIRMASYNGNVLLNYRLLDCETDQCNKYYLSAELIIMIEVLEHVDDYKVLSFVPSGKKLLITLPDFDSEGHVRHFTSEQQIREHYADYLDFESIHKFEQFWIIQAIKK